MTEFPQNLCPQKNDHISKHWARKGQVSVFCGLKNALGALLLLDFYNGLKIRRGEISVPVQVRSRAPTNQTVT